jgi:hypothetical protein
LSGLAKYTIACCKLLGSGVMVTLSMPRIYQIAVDESSKLLPPAGQWNHQVSTKFPAKSA